MEEMRKECGVPDAVTVYDSLEVFIDQSECKERRRVQPSGDVCERLARERMEEAPDEF